MDDSTFIEPCPFCADPMVMVNEVFQHQDQDAKCPIRQNAWQSSFLPSWNARSFSGHKELVEHVDALRQFVHDYSGSAEGEEGQRVEHDAQVAIDAIAAGLSTPSALLARVRSVLARILRAEDEAPGYGIYDCVDNDGERYQSADLAAALIDARAIIDTLEQAGAPS